MNEKIAFMKSMTTALTFLLFCTFGPTNVLLAQTGGVRDQWEQKISAEKSGSDLYITVKHRSHYVYPNETFWTDWKVMHEIRLGPTAEKELKYGLNKAVEWYDLNLQHKKEFEKEICRFKFIERWQYEESGYDEFYTETWIMTFIGNADSTFRLEFQQEIGRYSDLTIKTIEDVKDFIKILNGDTVEEEDDIFKH
jgi:hypothetical protein